MHVIPRPLPTLVRLIALVFMLCAAAGPANAQLRREESSRILDSERMFPGIRVSIEENYDCPGAMIVWTSRSRRATALRLPDGRNLQLRARGRDRYADGDNRIRFLDGALELTLAGTPPMRCASQLANPGPPK